MGLTEREGLPRLLCVLWGRRAVLRSVLPQRDPDVFILSVLAACSPPGPEQGDSLLIIQGRWKYRREPVGEMRRTRSDSSSRGDWTGISKGSAGMFSEGFAPAGGCAEGLRHSELSRGDSAGTLGVGGRSWRGHSWEPHRSAPGGPTASIFAIVRSLCRPPTGTKLREEISPRFPPLRGSPRQKPPPCTATRRESADRSQSDMSSLSDPPRNGGRESGLWRVQTDS